jgi:hypothetical protein
MGESIEEFNRGATLVQPSPAAVTVSPQDPTLYELMRLVLINPDIDTQDKKQLIDELRKNNPAMDDRWTYRYATWFLGGVVLLSVIALWSLGNSGKSEISQGLVALGSAALGGLAGLIAPNRTGQHGSSYS